MKVIAPGKLILSGEHAVVFGHPALAFALNYHTAVLIESKKTPLTSLIATDLGYQNQFTQAALTDFKQHIQKNYQQFLQGALPIREVLKAQHELLLFTVSLLADNTQGLEIRLNSTIPIGCGMGSSAALIQSVLHAILFYNNLSFANDALFQLSHAAENTQHGRSSGLDLHLAKQGGCLYFHNQTIHSRPLPTLKMWMVNTGVPETSTGTAVSHAAPFFKQSSLGQDFAAVTNGMDHALQLKHFAEVQTCIRRNHQLLKTIEVVPLKVAQFIQEIEAASGAAKICGAGAVLGQQAGMVIILMEDELTLARICEKYHYVPLPIQGDAEGVRLV